MYRTIYTQLWTDPKIHPLTKDGKLLFLYLLTNPYTHVSGIYHLPFEIQIKQTGISEMISNTLWHTLSDTLSIAYQDRETSTVFVVNMFGYQGTGEKNERAAANHLKTLHHSWLIGHFLQRYPSVKQYCPDTLSYTLSDRGSESGKSCPSVPNPNPLLLSSFGGEKIVKKRGNGKRPISEEDKPTEKHFSFGQSLGIDTGPEWGKFKNYCLAHDKRYANYEAAFRNWLANAKERKDQHHA